jgi:hypothetical protein
MLRVWREPRIRLTRGSPDEIAWGLHIADGNFNAPGYHTYTVLLGTLSIAGRPAVCIASFKNIERIGPPPDVLSPLIPPPPLLAAVREILCIMKKIVKVNPERINIMVHPRLCLQTWVKHPSYSSGMRPGLSVLSPPKMRS